MLNQFLDQFFINSSAILDPKMNPKPEQAKTESGESCSLKISNISKSKKILENIQNLKDQQDMENDENHLKPHKPGGYAKYLKSGKAANSGRERGGGGSH